MTGQTGQLSGRQMLAAMAYGVVLWFLAALLCRYLGELGAFKAGAAALVYAVIIPGTLPFVWFARPLLGIAWTQTFEVTTMATMAATLLDGIALTWMRPLYGVDPLGAAAAILWGAGVGLALALFVSRRARA